MELIGRLYKNDEFDWSFLFCFTKNVTTRSQNGIVCVFSF